VLIVVDSFQMLYMPLGLKYVPLAGKNQKIRLTQTILPVAQPILSYFPQFFGQFVFFANPNPKQEP
jgi:hypothetical protein